MRRSGDGRILDETLLEKGFRISSFAWNEAAGVASSPLFSSVFGSVATRFARAGQAVGFVARRSIKGAAAILGILKAGGAHVERALTQFPLFWRQ